MKYPLKPDLPNETRLRDLKIMMERGNHPSANDPSKFDILKSNYDKKTYQHFMIPILPGMFPNIDFLEMPPLGITE